MKVFDRVKEKLERGWINASEINERAQDVYLTKKGLMYVFNAGKYISSDVNLVLPVDIIKNNEVRKYLE